MVVRSDGSQHSASGLVTTYGNSSLFGTNSRCEQSKDIPNVLLRALEYKHVWKLLHRLHSEQANTQV